VMLLLMGGESKNRLPRIEPSQILNALRKARRN
jgi:hypothetical protein